MAQSRHNMIDLRPMQLEDYDAIVALWRVSAGVGLSAANERPAIACYLERNPGLSFTAWEGEMLVGAVLCGHDGRRGFLHHLAVRDSHQRQGIGQALVERCLTALRGQGIHKCHLFVFTHNRTAIAFWQQIGWKQRDDLNIMSISL